jgi:hypothetical protein
MERERDVTLIKKTLCSKRARAHSHTKSRSDLIANGIREAVVRDKQEMDEGSTPIRRKKKYAHPHSSLLSRFVKSR